MAASREWVGDSDSAYYMAPEARAEALCDELRSGARKDAIPGCICPDLIDMLRAAMAFPQKILLEDRHHDR